MVQKLEPETDPVLMVSNLGWIELETGTGYNEISIKSWE
jgi:hypothetical protein